MQARARRRPSAQISDLWTATNTTRPRLRATQVLARFPAMLAVLVLIESAF